MKTNFRPDLSIDSTYKVLDIGGGMNPHPQANYVLDMEDFETVKSYGNPEKLGRFGAETWIVHDICSSKPFPFTDHFFDFAVCTHVLEDVRDPLRVCEEMQRVAKAGYIEVPSIESELTHNLESHHYAGRLHHRWLVEVTDTGLKFTMKPHFVNGYWKTQIPRHWWKTDPKTDVRGLFWKDQFTVEEMHYHYEQLQTFLEEFVRRHRVYPALRYQTWDNLKALKKIITSIL
jgi:SAM-dependent methyltransferase